MRLRAAIVSIVVAGCQGSSSEPAEETLDLPDGPRTFTVRQRATAVVPGSDGRLRVHLGDITRGQVEMTVHHVDGRALVPPTSVEEGAAATFALGERSYSLEVTRFDTRLLGDDSATLTLVEGLSGRARIEALIAAVEASDVVFVRNGVEHDAAAAAAHLRGKWQKAQGRVRTVEQFIEHIATRSSMTGRPYLVRLPDGTERRTAAWLRERAREIG